MVEALDDGPTLHLDDVLRIRDPLKKGAMTVGSNLVRVRLE
jgi:hypothetical protein